MHSQDGDVVVHEAQHELRHQTRIPELVESVNKHSRKIYLRSQFKQSIEEEAIEFTGKED